MNQIKFTLLIIFALVSINNAFSQRESKGLEKAEKNTSKNWSAGLLYQTNNSIKVLLKKGIRPNTKLRMHVDFPTIQLINTDATLSPDQYAIITGLGAGIEKNFVLNNYFSFYHGPNIAMRIHHRTSTSSSSNQYYLDAAYLTAMKIALNKKISIFAELQPTFEIITKSNIRRSYLATLKPRINLGIVSDLNLKQNKLG